MSSDLVIYLLIHLNVHEIILQTTIEQLCLPVCYLLLSIYEKFICKLPIPTHDHKAPPPEPTAVQLDSPC